MPSSTARKTVLFLTVSLALAAAFPGPTLATGPGNKLIRGVINTSTGLLEIPNQMGQRKADGTTVMWALHGLVAGVSMGVARTLYGLYDIITFPVAPYDAPVLQPATLLVPKHGEESSSDSQAPPAPAAPTTNFTSRSG